MFLAEKNGLQEALFLRRGHNVGGVGENGNTSSLACLNGSDLTRVVCRFIIVVAQIGADGDAHEFILFQFGISTGFTWPATWAAGISIAVQFGATLGILFAGVSAVGRTTAATQEVAATAVTGDRAFEHPVVECGGAGSSAGCVDRRFDASAIVGIFLSCLYVGIREKRDKIRKNTGRFMTKFT
jgi:hypothetical protein